MRARPEIIFSDEDLLIVNKPPGLASVADRQNDQIHLLSWLKQKFGPVLPVHRLDAQTSGVICYARSVEEQRRLSSLFETRQIEKRYKALVSGIPAPSEGTIQSRIYKSEVENKVYISDKGKEAVTHYRIEEAFRSMSLVDIRLETGRTHQIRVHFESIGHPLVVDTTYGGRSELFLSELKKNYRGNKEEELPILSRTPLHAYQLTLAARDGEIREFRVSMPKDMTALINQLRKL